MIFETLCLGRSKLLSYVCKNTQKWTAFVFGNIYLHKIFTKLCLINMHIFIYSNTICNCKLWQVPWFYFVLEYFHTTTIHVWIDLSPPNFHRVYVWLIYIFCDVSMPNVTAGYGRISDLLHFCQIFTNCVMRQKCIEMKSNPI